MNAPLDEDVGQKLAEWAAGGEAAKGDAALIKDRDSWISFWAKKGVSATRVMASLGKANIDDFDRRDLVTLRMTLDAIKAKKTTVAEAFPESTAPTDADDFGEEATPGAESEKPEQAASADGESGDDAGGETAESGDEPTPEEWAAIEAAQAKQHAVKNDRRGRR
jgi:hypothetical protein